VARTLDLACEIQQIPAPTFAEHERAAFVRDQFAKAGLVDVWVDELGNVYGRRPGAGRSRPLLVSAHTDTVFPADTSLTLLRRPELISGPGIGDNSLGVAGLFALLWALGDTPPPGDLWLAANVGEEGLGDLRGIRAVIDRLGGIVAGTIVLEGMALGRVYHAGIGVRRYRLSAEAEGGHSWLNFGRPSAIHRLVRLAAALTDLDVSRKPRTTFNIGVIRGGTSVNTIARTAELELDLRSESPATLAALSAQVEALVARHQNSDAPLRCEVIGDRPPGSIAPEHGLVKAAISALGRQGLSATLDTGSTDANLPLSRSLPCVCIGLTTGANAHRPDEYIDTAPLDRGLAALNDTVALAFEWARG
jgi:acetylornithine deacetylase/succinyl-diaminopimelate desuccinylase-like protein